MKYQSHNKYLIPHATNYILISPRATNHLAKYPMLQTLSYYQLFVARVLLVNCGATVAGDWWHDDVFAICGTIDYWLFVAQLLLATQLASYHPACQQPASQLAG